MLPATAVALHNAVAGTLVTPATGAGPPEQPKGPRLRLPPTEHPT